MAHSKRSDLEYKNWVNVGLAIKITHDGLETIVQKAVDNYHSKLLANAKLLKNKKAWKSHLTTAHRSNDKRKISWINSDNTKWLSQGASWEIAKIFMAPLGNSKHDVVNAQTTDISGLLNILEWSPRGLNGMFNTGVDLSKLADARRFRNIWAHAPQFHISDDDKADAFASFRSLLQDPELSHDKDVQDTINELNKLLNDGVAVIEEKELELFVQLQSQLAQDIVSLDSNITDWKDQVDASLKQIEDQMKSLDELLKENKLQNAIETIKKKMDEHVQSTNSRLEKLEASPSSEHGQSVGDGKSSVKFNPVCDRMKEAFVGREWLFRDIDSWVEKNLGPRRSRAFSIRGGPGTGKSSIARELVRRQEGKKLAGYHYFQKDNPCTCDLESLVNSLSHMLSKSLPEYAAFITHEYSQEANKFRDIPKKLFDYLITTPLQHLQENTNHFLLIGALDEGGDMISSCFAGLSAVLPSWLRIVFTARNNATALFDLFPGCNCANLDLDTINPQATKHTNRRNLKEDMHAFVTMKYRKLQNEYHDNTPTFFQNNPKRAIRTIIKQSRYCFLYAKLVMEHIFTYDDEFVNLPPTLSEIYCLDFRRLISDKQFFENKVAPVLEVVLAIKRIQIKIPETRILPWLLHQFETSGAFLKKVIEMGHLPGITTRDLNNALKLLSVYLCEDSCGVFRFSHVSVETWLQVEKSDFFCDVTKGHDIMAKFHLKVLQMRPEDPKPYLHCYLSHSSFLPQPRSINVNFFVSALGIKVTDFLDVAFLHIPEDLVMKVLDETDVLDKMSLEKKTEHLLFAVVRKYERVAAKLISSAHWIITFVVQYGLKCSDIMTKSQHFVKEIESLHSLPQLLFFTLCTGDVIYQKEIKFCVEHGVTADVCVPKFFKNTEQFDVRTCWNEDTQEYFRKLKSGEKNIITLDSLKENPSSPKEARIDDYSLEVIENPIAEVERLVREGECYVCFTHGWHVMALSSHGKKGFQLVEYLLKHGADVNNRGNLGKTALMMACEKQNIDLVSFLLNHGADMEQQDFYGSTALHHALDRKNDSNVEPNSSTQKRIIEILLEHGADPRYKNSRGVSAIDIAEREGGNVLEMLTGKRRRRDGSETDPDTSM